MPFPERDSLTSSSSSRLLPQDAYATGEKLFLINFLSKLAILGSSVGLGRRLCSRKPCAPALLYRPGRFSLLSAGVSASTVLEARGCSLTNGVYRYKEKQGLQPRELGYSGIWRPRRVLLVRRCGEVTVVSSLYYTAGVSSSPWPVVGGCNPWPGRSVLRSTPGGATSLQRIPPEEFRAHYYRTN